MQRKNEEKEKEKEFYNSVVVNSSNIYYKNQDQKQQRMAELKGSGNDIAKYFRFQENEMNKER